MIEDYITSRLEPQILYYEKRSALFRREHNALSILTLFLMASIAASILSGILYFHNAKEQWQKYQALAQSLRSEKETYLYCAGAHLSIEAQKEKDSLFVATCEAILSNAKN